MLRQCPHCKAQMDVFDENCPACGGHSKAGLLHQIGAVIHGYRSFLFVAAVLAVAWIILSRIIK
jgi:hypothetical protein